jgi:hypothetical protein
MWKQDIQREDKSSKQMAHLRNSTSVIKVNLMSARKNLCIHYGIVTESSCPLN